MNPATLVYLEDKKVLPDKPGVYSVLNRCGQVLYVGQAQSLNKRFAKHGRGIDFCTNGASKIAYAVIEDPGERTQREIDAIQKYQPPLNQQHRSK